MWLSYYKNFTELICQNIDPNPHTYDSGAEFPTRYHFLLYKIISNQCEWIRAIESLPEEQENIQLESTSISHENDNIPKSAIMSLVNSLYKIVQSENIDDSFKCYMARIVFRNYLELKETERFPDYIELFRSAIVQGGWFERDEANTYKRNLLDCLMNRFDHIPHDNEDIEELEEALKENI